MKACGKGLAVAVALVGFTWSSLAGAEELSYWTFNANSLAPAFGQAGATLLTADIGFGGEGYGTGTTVNALNGYPAGKSLEYYAVVAATFQELTFTGLNFTNAVDARMSFATISTHLFDVGERMVVEYSTNGGLNYQTAQVLANPTAAWDVRTVDFGTALNGHSNVRIRVQTSAVFEAGSRLAFDNVQIVPEPSSLALCALGILAVAGVGLRRRFR